MSIRVRRHAGEKRNDNVRIKVSHCSIVFKVNSEVILFKKIPKTLRSMMNFNVLIFKTRKEHVSLM